MCPASATTRTNVYTRVLLDVKGLSVSGWAYSSPNEPRFDLATYTTKYGRPSANKHKVHDGVYDPHTGKHGKAVFVPTVFTKGEWDGSVGGRIPSGSLTKSQQD
jgi:hypothetical protein